MFQEKVFSRSLFFCCIIIFCFLGNADAAKTHNIDTGWTLAEIRDKIEKNQTVQTPDTLGFGAHLWFNAKCIEFYEKWTGDYLTDQEKTYIMLGGVTADYAIAGSSDTEDLYNTVGWHTPLGNNWNGEYKGVQETKSTNHFFNGKRTNKSLERLTDFPSQHPILQEHTDYPFNGFIFWKLSDPLSGNFIWTNILMFPIKEITLDYVLSSCKFIEETVLTHVSAPEWAFNHPDNNYDLNDAFANRGTVGSFRAIGEVEHLILDMIIPDHTRNDNHSDILNYGVSYCEGEIAKIDYNQLDSTSIFPNFRYPDSMKLPGADLMFAFCDLQKNSSGNYFSEDTMFKTKHAGVSLPEVNILSYSYKDEDGYHYIVNSNRQKLAKYDSIEISKPNFIFPATYEQAHELVEKGYITLAGYEDLWADLAPKAIAYGVGLIYIYREVTENDIGYFADGWDRKISKAVYECYYNNGGRECFGYPENYGKGRFVHSLDGVYYTIGDTFVSPSFWVQEYSGPNGDHRYMLVYNAKKEEAFHIHGRLLERWEIEYEALGAPTSGEYFIDQPANLIRQDFEYGYMIWDGEQAEVSVYYKLKLSWLTDITVENLQTANFGSGGSSDDGIFADADDLSDLSVNENGVNVPYKGSDDNYLYPYLENVPTDLIELADMLKILTPTNIYGQWAYNPSTGGYEKQLVVVADGVAHGISDVEEFLNKFNVEFESLPPFRYYREEIQQMVNVTNTFGGGGRWREVKEKGWLIPSGIWTSECESRWREYLIDGRKLGDYINATPEFLAEYKGSKIKAGLPGQPTYLMTEVGINELGPYRGGMDFLMFDLYLGLQPAGKLEWTTEETFRYFNKSTEEYIRAARNGFGKGTEYAPEGYEGDYNPTEFEIFFQEQKEAGMELQEILQLWHNMHFSENEEYEIETPIETPIENIPIADGPEVVEVTGNEVEITKRFYVGNGDGQVETSPYPSSFFAQRNDVNGREVNFTGAHITSNVSCYYFNSGYLGIRRAFFPIDTSGIPDDSVIISAKLGIYVTSAGDAANDEYSYFALVKTDQANTDKLENADIDNIGEENGGERRCANILKEQYNELELNASGLDWISKTGYTKLGLREGHDLENSDNSINTFNNRAWGDGIYITFCSSENDDENKRPYLEVTYMAAKEEVGQLMLEEEIDIVESENEVVSVTEETITADGPEVEATDNEVEITKRFYVGAGDGRMQTGPYPSSFDTQRNDTKGREVNWTATTMTVNVSCYLFNSGYLGIGRAFFPIDTSAIPDNATIVSAKLCLYVNDLGDQAQDDYSYFVLVQTDQAHTDKLENADIDNVGAEGGGEMHCDNIFKGEYNSWNLNETGLSWISRTGWTKLGLKEGHDLENNVTTISGWNRGTWADGIYITVSSSESDGIERDPYLEVTYVCDDTEGL